MASFSIDFLTSPIPAIPDFPAITESNGTQNGSSSANFWTSLESPAFFDAINASLDSAYNGSVHNAPFESSDSVSHNVLTLNDVSNKACSNQHNRSVDSGRASSPGSTNGDEPLPVETSTPRAHSSMNKPALQENKVKQETVLIDDNNNNDNNSNSNSNEDQNKQHGSKDSEDPDVKPAHSYIALISMAILSTEEKKLLLCDIYDYIIDNFSYYKLHEKEKAWRNSVRHNLSLNECFIKDGRSDNGKGNYWAIHPACIEDFKKGDYRRRQARRRAKRATLPQNMMVNSPIYGNNTGSAMTTQYSMKFARNASYHPYRRPHSGSYYDYLRSASYSGSSAGSVAPPPNVLCTQMGSFYPAQNGSFNGSYSTPSSSYSSTAFDAYTPSWPTAMYQQQQQQQLAMQQQQQPTPEYSTLYNPALIPNATQQSVHYTSQSSPLALTSSSPLSSSGAPSSLWNQPSSTSSITSSLLSSSSSSLQNTTTQYNSSTNKSINDNYSTNLWMKNIM